MMERLSRILARPQTLALVFAPIALAVWAIQLRLGLPSEQAYVQAAEWVQVIMLGLGAVLYFFVRRHRSEPETPPSLSATRFALYAALVALFAQFVTANMQFSGSFDPLSMTARLANVVLFVALAEELWFRGLWMRSTASSLVLAVVVGALAFGLLHWPLGPGRVATTAALGLLYAAARWRGAPLWALALAHGSVNWVSASLAPATEWRFGALGSQTLFCLLVLVSAGIMLRNTIQSGMTR